MSVTAHPARMKVGTPDYMIMFAVGALVVLGVLVVYSFRPGQSRTGACSRTAHDRTRPADRGL